jgi:hypothetical protein
MLRFHRHLAAGHPPAAALALAQRELMDKPSAAMRAAALGFVCFGS